LGFVDLELQFVAECQKGSAAEISGEPSGIALGICRVNKSECLFEFYAFRVLASELIEETGIDDQLIDVADGVAQLSKGADGFGKM